MSKGFGIAYGFGEQSSADTSVSRTNWLPGAEGNTGLTKATEYSPRPHLGYYGQGSQVMRGKYPTGNVVGGGIKVIPAYDDSTLLLLAHALGGTTTTGASAPYTHKLAPATDLGDGLTIEQIGGTDPAGSLDMARVYTGCFISDFELRFAAGELSALTLSNIIALSGGAMASAGSPSFNQTAEPVRFNHGSDLTWGGTDYAIDELVIRGNRNLTRLPKLGSLDTRKPIANGMFDLTVEFVYVYQSNQFLNDNNAGTSRDGSVTFTGTGDNSLTVNIHNAYVESVSDPKDTMGVLRQSVVLKPQSDGTDHGIDLTFTNDNSSATAN